jgi:hypothetical protein
MSKKKIVKLVLLYFLAAIVILGRIGNALSAHSVLGVMDAVTKLY